MKPVRLTFGGLGSYREKQSVDFDRLGSGGLFGVFGPTGSGKSTVLDAITLALFGHVPRAERGTRGIINQRESALEVSLEFWLGKWLYRVERRYERDPKVPESVRAKAARLRRLGGDEEVLASSPSETTLAVEALLGLTRDEFCRAVVLPQGRFDEFLRLTGGDRAKMLEHIFGLERFGDELANRAKRKRDAFHGRLIAIDGEKTGLGDCSPEAINGIKKDLESECLAFDTLETQCNELRLRLVEAKGLRDLYLETARAEERLGRLVARSDEMKGVAERILAGEKAEGLREVLEQVGDMARDIDLAQERLQMESAELSKACDAHDEAVLDLRKAEGEKEEHLPRLLERQSDLAKAIEQIKALKGLNEERLRRLELYNGKKADFDSVEIAWRGQKKRLAELRERHRQVLLDKKRLEVDPEDRATVESGMEILVRLEAARYGLEEARAEYDRRTEDACRAWERVISVVGEVLPGVEVSPEGARVVLDATLAEAEDRLSEAAGTLKEAQWREHAFVLASALEEDMPCPVCGSSHHPLPAERPSEGLEGLQAAELEASKRLVDMRAWRERAVGKIVAWEEACRGVAQAENMLNRRLSEESSVAREFEAVCGDYGPASLRSRRQEIFDLDRRTHEVSKEIEDLQGQIEGTEVEFENSSRRMDAARGEMEQAKSNLEEITWQVNGLSNQVETITMGAGVEELAKTVQADLEALSKSVEGARQREKCARETRERLEASVGTLKGSIGTLQQGLKEIGVRLDARLSRAGFGSVEEAKQAMVPEDERARMRADIDEYQKAVNAAEAEIKRLEAAIADRCFSEEDYHGLSVRVQGIEKARDAKRECVAVLRDRLKQLEETRNRWIQLKRESVQLGKQLELVDSLVRLVQGRKLVQFMAEEHLRDMAHEASQRLGRLSGQRYALELAEDSGFVIRDDYNGGLRRSVSTLSGGETFLTSLALALSLSSKIQLRGEYPLGFFFLDEGFGSLDDEKLEVVIGALERIHERDRMVGVISHVRGLKERLPRYLEVTPSGLDGSGSRISLRGN